MDEIQIADKKEIFFFFFFFAFTRMILHKWKRGIKFIRYCENEKGRIFIFLSDTINYMKNSRIFYLSNNKNNFILNCWTNLN